MDPARPKPRPRKLLRRTNQVDDYLANASLGDIQIVLEVLDCIQSGDPGCWDRLWQIPSPVKATRMSVLMPNGHALVWEDFTEVAVGHYALVFIGPA